MLNLRLSQLIALKSRFTDTIQNLPFGLYNFAKTNMAWQNHASNSVDYLDYWSMLLLAAFGELSESEGQIVKKATISWFMVTNCEDGDHLMVHGHKL